MRRALPFLAIVLVAALVAIGLSQAGGGGARGSSDFDLDAAKARLRGAPAPLAALHAQSSQLLDGGKEAFDGRMRSLRGHPVVVNVWGSWCPPCRGEFPVLQRVATDRGREIAFVGVDTIDPRDNARRFLASNPLPYPSYVDPRGTLAKANGLVVGAPVTAFYDESGRRVFVKQGEYRRAADLEADIEKYL